MKSTLTLSPAQTPRQRGDEIGQAGISIVVPVLNEAPLIANFLQRLRARAPEAEIIVVDGGSSDGTADLAAGLCDRLIPTQPGRAAQMNAGAREARGELLWFLHVDVEVPPGCLDEIRRRLADPMVTGGFFRIRLGDPAFVYRLTDEFAHYASLALRMRCGDHGIFCRRADFLALGGFPEVPLMEDVEFFRRLRRRGRVICTGKRMMVSPRRYQAVGPIQLTLAYGLIALLYLLRVPLPRLSEIYERFCSQRA